MYSRAISGLKYFDRGGQIPGQHLAAVVVEGHDGGPVCIHLSAEQAIADKTEGVGHHGDLQAVLGDVFGLDVAHQGASGR